MSVTALARLRRGKRAEDVELIGGRYVRASQDHRGRSISVASQDAEGEEFFDENDIKHYATYSDNNQSGSLYATEVRENYERALQDLRDRRINLLWSFDNSRAQRDMELYARLRRICIETGSFWAYGGRIYDMTDPQDRKITARDAAEAEGAADNISIHTQRGVRSRAKRGEHAGQAAYGYELSFCPKTGQSLGWVISWEEAKVVRRIVKSCLDLKSLTSIAARLNRDGVPCPREGRWDVRKVRKLVEDHQHPAEWNRFLDALTPENQDRASVIVARVHGGESPKEIGRELNREGVPYFFRSLWCEVKVRNIALSPAAAGLRMHHAEVVRVKEEDPDEPGEFRMVPKEVTWKRIKTLEEHDQLVALLTAPGRTVERDGTRVKHWWTGIGRCGVCESPLSRRKCDGVSKYFCSGNGCVTRDQGRVDAWLTELALDLLEREDAAALFRVERDSSNGPTARIEAQRLRAKLDGFRQQVLAEQISPESFAVFEADLLPKIRKADESAKRAAVPSVLFDVIGPDARTAFMALEVAVQRKILRAIMRPRINPTKRRMRKGLDTDAIDPGFLYTIPDSPSEVDGDPVADAEDESVLNVAA